MNENETNRLTWHPKEYADCAFCGGLVEPGVGLYNMQFRGRLCLIEGVPMGICNQCGEKFIHAKVGLEIDRILLGEAGPPHKVEVDAFKYEDVDQAA